MEVCRDNSLFVSRSVTFWNSVPHGKLPKAWFLSSKQQHGRKGENIVCEKVIFIGFVLAFRAFEVYIKMFRGIITPRRVFPSNFIARKSTYRGVQEALDSNSSVSRDTKYAASRRGSFFQEAPRLGNQFSGDLFLQSYLKRILPYEV